MHFKDQPLLVAAPLVPARPFRLPLPGGVTGALARTYNRVGGLIRQLSGVTEIDAVALLAAWQTISHGRPFRPGQAVLRFEVQHFFRHWGRANETGFDAHFQFGGRRGVPGGGAANQRMRGGPDQAWTSVHASQACEQTAFALAERLGGTEPAALSSAFGPALVRGCDHADCGYGDAAALRRAFNADERWQVLGWFDYCESNAWLDLLRARQWRKFAQACAGGAETLGPRLAEAWAMRDQLLALPRD